MTQSTKPQLTGAFLCYNLSVARMAKLVDALASGASVLQHKSSSLFAGTIFFILVYQQSHPYPHRLI